MGQAGDDGAVVTQLSCGEAADLREWAVGGLLDPGFEACAAAVADQVGEAVRQVGECVEIWALRPCLLETGTVVFIESCVGLRYRGTSPDRI